MLKVEACRLGFQQNGHSRSAVVPRLSVNNYH
jgi:hypothetical protein